VVLFWAGDTPSSFLSFFPLLNLFVVLFFSRQSIPDFVFWCLFFCLSFSSSVSGDRPFFASALLLAATTLVG
jgi:hypothetical protein